MGVPRILCVDDEESNVILLEAVLAPLGYEVFQAGDGKQALMLLRHNKIDLVLLDVMMPGMDGYTVCRTIKSDPQLSSIPVVMITSLTAKEDRIRSIEAGAEDFLSKPFDHVEVTARVKMLLKVRSLDNSLRQSYANINQLTHFGKSIIKNFNPLKFKLLSVMDQVVDQVITHHTAADDHPETIIVGILPDAGTWKCYMYSEVHDKIIRTVVPSDIQRNVILPIPINTKIATYQNEDIHSPHIAPLAEKLTYQNITLHNILMYMSDTIFVLCCNYKREITQYDADVLNAIVMQTVFLQTIHAQVEEISKAFDYSLHALARASEVHDTDTGNHILRVGEYSALLARRLNMPQSFIHDIKLHAVTHDVGKMHIPLEILLKPGRLTENEFFIMKKHTRFGALILGDHIRLRMAKNIALHHHENWKGNGYPAGLVGEAIPIEARIVKLADQYDALRSRRTYKQPFDHQTAYHILTEGDARTDPATFDPNVLQAFIEAQAQFNDIYKRLNTA